MKIINISGEIGWDVMPEDIKSQLTQANGADIDVHVSSPGGYVWDGIEIYNAFRDYKRNFPSAQMMLTIKSIAASMASYLSVNPAFDLVAAEDNAVFMIHNAIGGTYGDYRDMLKMAEILKGCSELLGQAYCGRCKKSKKEIKEMMDAETWLFGSEILDAGFVDEIIKTDEASDRASALSGAIVQFKAVSEKIKSEHIDFEKIAAVLKQDYNQVKEPENNILTPATAGIKEDHTMNLAQFLAENPAANAELDIMLKAERDAGKKEAFAMAEKAETFATNKEYPETVRNYAVSVMAGKKSFESLEALVVNVDMIKELQNSNAAALESANIGDTNGHQSPVACTDGVIDSPADFMAEINRTKNASGVEVR